MNEILRLNLEALFQRYPAFRRRESEIRVDGLESGFSEGHSPILRRQGSLKRSAVYLLEGLKTSAALNWVSKNSFGADSVFIVVEKQLQDFALLASQMDLRKFIEDTRFHFVVGGGVQDFASQLMVPFHSKRRAALLGNLFILRDPEVNGTDSDFYEACEQQLNNCVKLFTSISGHRQDGLTGLKYLVQNIPWIESHPGVNRLENIFAGASAVVASTGPSLSKSLGLLKTLQNSHVIIAADASLKILLNAGIEPHFVCTMERELASKPFFDGIPLEKAKTHLVSFPEVPQEVIGAYPGPQWVAYRKQLAHLFFQQQMPRGMIGSGHSVAHMCMQLAAWMGCSRLALIGQDLAFDPDSLSSHAENVAYSQWSSASSKQDLQDRLAQEGDSLTWVAGNLREQVPTRGYYIVFAWEFGAQASLLKMEVTNCTEGGMKIPQIPWLDFGTWCSRSKEANGIHEKVERARLETVSGKADLSLLLKSIEGWKFKLQNQSQVIRGVLDSHTNTLDPTISMFLSPAKALLSEIRNDHVIEAFALDILGREVVPFEMKLMSLEDEREWQLEDWKLIGDYFALLTSALDDVRNVLTQKVK